MAQGLYLQAHGHIFLETQMKNSTFKTAATAALVLGFALAPAANAQPRPETGVGLVIAVQGNRALELIKAELKATIQAWTPVQGKLQIKRPASVTRAPTADAAGVMLAETVRCAP